MLVVPVPSIPVLRTVNASAAVSTSLYQLPAHCTHTGQEQPNNILLKGAYVLILGSSLEIKHAKIWGIWKEFVLHKCRNYRFIVSLLSLPLPTAIKLLRNKQRSLGAKKHLFKSELFFYSSDDVDFRGSTTTLAPSTAPSFGVSQIQPSPSMPWLGTGQTSTGAGVVSIPVCAAQESRLFIVCYLVERPSVLVIILSIHYWHKRPVVTKTWPKR